ncbi:MAG: LLM class flavin-dependent oxidoreductase [Pseudomonadota bacterium]|nr:LLM class flavin-dependent oxidoreductase [Pseudomonadota bacterium]
MHFGTFMEFGTRPGVSHAEAFREGFDHARLCEDVGLDSVWLSEFHFMPDRSVLSSPIVVAGALTQCTKRVRIGMAVYVLPLTNPLRVAEETASVDQMSGGRLDFGIGRSGFARQYKIYNIDYSESQARFEEAVTILRKAWSGEKFSHEGQFFQVTDAQLVPVPVQSPHPPMRMAASSPGTFKKVAAEGLPLFVGLRGDGLEELKGNIQVYRKTWNEMGHADDSSVFLRVPVYAAATKEAALEEPRKCITHYFERQARMIAAAGAQGASAEEMRSRTAKALAALSYDDIRRSRAAIGSPGMLVDQFTEWQEVLDIDGVVMELNAGNMLTEKQINTSVRLIAEDVMPAFR